MTFDDDAMSVATAPIPGAEPGDEVQKAFDAMPLADLAALWSALQSVGLKQQTEATWDAKLYFNRLPHDAPGRTLDVALEVLRTETDRGIRLELGRDLMTTLVHRHAATLVERLEREAADNASLRWLLGGAYWWCRDEALQARLEAIADVGGWRADEAEHSEAAVALDCEALSVAELAEAWIEQKSKADKDRDANWHALCDYERDLRDDDPDKMLDVILAVLARETHPALLSLLAAGPLEDVISMQVIDRIEQEAAGNERFRDLLRGVWYWSKPDDLKVRLDAILKTDA